MTAACRPSCRCFKCWRYPEAGSGVHGWAALAHTVQNPTEAAYARSDHFERRRRRLMDEWAAHLRGPRGQAWHDDGSAYRRHFAVHLRESQAGRGS